jgi:hypothetical protein
MLLTFKAQKKSSKVKNRLAPFFPGGISHILLQFGYEDDAIHLGGWRILLTRIQIKNGRVNSLTSYPEIDEGHRI